MAANNSSLEESSGYRGKAWVFTVNNYSPSSLKDLEPTQYEYLVYGREEAPGTGTKHLQGYVVFKDRKRRTQVSKVLPGAWLQAAKGSPKEASDYCKKGGDFVEEGVLPEGLTGAASASRAAKSKWDAIKLQAQLGDIESIEGSAYVQHYRTLQQIASDHCPRATDLDDVCGIWYVGPPGCGKSHAARALVPDYYLKPMNKWWDGFNPRVHECVVLEDLDLEQVFMGHYLKNWADKWSFAAEKKGSTTQIRPKQIVVTSNYTIEQIWHSDASMVQALRRRFTVTSFPAKNSPFSRLNTLVEVAVPRAGLVDVTSVLPCPGTPTSVQTPLRRQNAHIFSRESIGDVFEWEDEDQSQRPIADD